MKGHLPAVSSTRCFSNIILFANFVTAYSCTSNKFIKYTFIKYQNLFIYFLFIKKIIATQIVSCIINSPHLVPKTPRLIITQPSIYRVIKHF